MVLARNGGYLPLTVRLFFSGSDFRGVKPPFRTLGTDAGVFYDVISHRG